MTTGTNEKASDHFYACLTKTGGYFDDYPDVMIGRLSVGNENELSNVVTKIIDYETTYATGDWRDDILLFEGQDFTSDFNDIDDYLQLKENTTHFLYNHQPPRADADYMYYYANKSEARASLIDQINDGRFIVNYEASHGSKFGWHSGGHCNTYFDVTDIPSLSNGAKLSFFINVCCETGWFDNITPDPCFGANVDCFAEQFQYSSDKGAIGILASSRGDYPSSYGVVDKYVYEAIFNNTEYILGGVVLEAKLGWWSSIRHRYNLFGDPAQNLFPQGLTSNSPEATAFNNSRKLLRDEKARYHLVFESNGEIYYHYSMTDKVWLGGFRLSTGNGNNKYSSITGTSNKQFVVWQRYNTSTNNYDIFFTKNTGSGWSTPTTISRLSDLTSTANPLPVISYKTISGGHRLMVCIKGQKGSDDGILYQYSDDEGITWYPTSNYQLYRSTSSHQNPSLSMGPTTPTSPICFTYDDGNKIYFHTYDSDWSSRQTISLGSGVYNTDYSSVEVDGDGGKNVAWQGYSNSLNSDVIVHRRRTSSWSSFKIFTTSPSNGYYNPSITGHTGDKRTIVWHAQNGTLHRAHYDGSYWTESLSYEVFTRNPNISAGTTIAKYCWTENESSPYEIKMSSETMPVGGLLKLDSSENRENVTQHNSEYNYISHRS